MADGDNERPEYQYGVGTIGGSQFHWGSGTPGKYWSIPYGDYPVTPNAPTGAWAHQVGAIPIANNVIPDPQLGRNRIGIMIHSGSADSLDQLYTQGCFKVDPQDWPAVRTEILSEAQKGPLYLHVQPGGVAAFTNTKTLSQAGDETPAATANATANTTAAKPSYNFTLPANAPMGMGNNNPLNIKYYPGAEKDYQGLTGPSKNTDQGDPQMVFATPEAGWGAAYSLLNKKYGSGMTTPNQIIAGKGGWTPGNTEAAANVAKSAGIGPDDDIGFSDPAKAQKFMRALVTQEQGSAGAAYPDAMIAGVVSGKPGTAVASGQPVGGAVGTTINSLAGSPDKPSPFMQGASELEKGLSGQAPGLGQGEAAPQVRPVPIAQPPPPANVSPLFGPQYGKQLYGTTLNSMMTPPHWGSGPPGVSPYATGATAGGMPVTAGTPTAAGIPQGATAQQFQQMQQQLQQQALMQQYGGMGGLGGMGGMGGMDYGGYY